MKTKLAYGILLILLIVPYTAAAASRAPNSSVWNISILAGPLVTCSGPPVTVDSGGTEATNGGACQNVCDLISTAANVVYFGIGVVLWIIMPIMFAWAGILFMISRGSSEKTGEARKMITGAVIGLLIVVCAYIIVYTFVHVLGIASSIGGFGGAISCTIPT